MNIKLIEMNRDFPEIIKKGINTSNLTDYLIKCHGSNLHFYERQARMINGFSHMIGKTPGGYIDLRDYAKAYHFGFVFDTKSNGKLLLGVPIITCTQVSIAKREYEYHMDPLLIRCFESSKTNWGIKGVINELETQLCKYLTFTKKTMS